MFSFIRKHWCQEIAKHIAEYSLVISRYWLLSRNGNGKEASFFPVPSVVIIETVRSREIFNKSCLENVEG